MQRHPMDIVSFVFGIIFVGAAATGMFVDEDVTLLQARWIWPALLIVAGAVIVAYTMRRDTAGTRPSQPQPYDPVD